MPRPQVVTRVTSAWHPKAAKPEDVTEAPGSGTDYICPHGSQVSFRLESAAWTNDINKAFGGIMDHGGPSRRSSLESEAFLILGLHCRPEPGEPAVRRQVWRLSLHLHKFQADIHHQGTLPGNGSK